MDVRNVDIFARAQSGGCGFAGVCMSSLLRLIAPLVLATMVTTAARSEEFGSQAVIQSPWTKFCLSGMCFTGSGSRTECRPIMSVTLLERNNETKKVLQFALPRSVDVDRGARLQIDDGEPITRPFGSCNPAGCPGSYEAGPELVDQLAHGQVLTIDAVNRDNSPLHVTVPLAGFAAAHGGPAPEPKVYEEQLSSREFQKRIAEADREREERKTRCGSD